MDHATTAFLNAARKYNFGLTRTLVTFWLHHYSAESRLQYNTIYDRRSVFV